MPDGKKNSISYVNYFKNIDEGPFSIFKDGHFNDESYKVKHSEPGMIGMAKESGYASTNECIFYVTIGAPLSYMDNKNVIFARVVNGMRTFNMISK